MKDKRPSGLQSGCHKGPTASFAPQRLIASGARRLSRQRVMIKIKIPQLPVLGFNCNHMLPPTPHRGRVLGAVKEENPTRLTDHRCRPTSRGRRPSPRQRRECERGGWGVGGWVMSEGLEQGWVGLVGLVRVQRSRLRRNKEGPARAPLATLIDSGQ